MLDVDITSTPEVGGTLGDGDLRGRFDDLDRSAIELALEEVSKLELQRQVSLVVAEYGIDLKTAQAWELDYRRWLVLNKCLPSASLVPTGPIDSVWHKHILDTMKYFHDCEGFFGYYLHHTPNIDSTEADRLEMEASFRDTQRLWQKCFETELSSTDQRFCGPAAGCRNY